jgi:two-component system CheB/CheR fusion protein
MADLRQTLDQGHPREKDVAGPEGRHYLVKMLPYRVPSSAMKGAVVSFVDMTSAHQLSHLQTVLDALTEQIAVLDVHGTITMVNAAWRQFAKDNGDPEMRHCGLGANYLLACQSSLPVEGLDLSSQLAPASVVGLSDAVYARQASQGIRQVLNALRPSFRMEYPCHSPSCQRWFVMCVSPLYHPDDVHRLRGAVVSHINITEWRAEHPVSETPLV